LIKRKKMISIRKMAELLGAKSQDMADLLLVSRRSVYYIFEGRLDVPHEFAPLIQNIVAKLSNPLPEVDSKPSDQPLTNRYRLSLERRLATLELQRRQIALRIQKNEPSSRLLKLQKARLESLPDELAPSELRRHFTKWKKRMIDRTIVAQSRHLNRQLTNDRIRLAAIEAEITALDKVLAVS
jgi:hypothetical protein